MEEYKPKTRQEIFAETLALKTNYEQLDSLDNQGISDEQTLFDRLNSKVKVAIWILWIHIISIAIWINQETLALGIEEQKEIRDTSNFGNAKSVEYTIKKFQDGDEVIIDPETNKIEYETVDESKQIVEYSAATSVNGAALIKTRRKDSDIFTIDEKARLDSYWNQVGILGINYLIQNSTPDIFKLIGTIKYKGEKNVGELQTDVESLINQYITNISFSGMFIKNDFIKSILSIDGIIDFEITTIQAKSATGTYENILFRYEPVAGYMNIDDDYPLNQNVTYEIENIY